jgi:hypothetical protein
LEGSDFASFYEFTIVSSGTPVSSTNKTDHHDIAEVLLKVALSTNKQANTHLYMAPVMNS